MSDDHELHSPAVQWILDGAVEALSGLISEHEHANHGDEPCMDERMNMIAWVAHRIGWAPRGDGEADLRSLWKRIAAYKKHHDEEHHGD